MSEVEECNKTVADKALLTRECEAFFGRKAIIPSSCLQPDERHQERLQKIGIDKAGFGRFIIRREHCARILDSLRCEAHAESARNVVEDFLENG